MTGYQIGIEAWDYATGGQAQRDRVTALLASEYGVAPDAVREVLDAHKARVDGLYNEARDAGASGPSLAALEAADEVCLEALGNLKADD